MAPTVVGVRPALRAISGHLSPTDMQIVSDWIRSNEAALVDYWDGGDRHERAVGAAEADLTAFCSAGQGGPVRVPAPRMVDRRILTFGRAPLLLL